MNIKKYLIERHNGRKSRQLNSQYEISLPVCPTCGKDKDHFNFNIKTERGGCLKCGFGVGVVGLVQTLENISSKKAKEFIANDGLDVNKLDSVVNILKRSSEQEDLIIHHVNSELPDEFELMYDALRDNRLVVPKGFADRDYSTDTLKKFQMGFCKTGSYAARIIFPIYSEDKKSFVARKIHEWMNKKYKNPPESKHSQLLYGYNLIPEDVIIFICEGPTDVLRLADYGFYAVCTFGKKISMEQVDLLFKLKPKEVVCVFDGDALEQNIKAFEKISMRLVSSYLMLPEDNDPDSVSKTVFDSCFNKRKKFDRLNYIEEILTK